MLDINPEIVCHVIEQAREFHADEDLGLKGAPEGPDDESALKVLAELRTNERFALAQAAIDDLEPDQQQTLVALMWVGRGDFDAADFDSALQTAQEAWTPRTAEYLLATPLVADYLEEALAQLGYACE